MIKLQLIMLCVLGVAGSMQAMERPEKVDFFAMKGAIISKDKEELKKLLDAGGNVNDAGLLGTPLLVVAAEYDDSGGIIDLLISYGADTELAITRNYYKDTALITAVRKNNVDAVKHLLAGGAYVNGRNGSEETALHVAAQQGYRDIVNLLVEAGADLSIRDVVGDRPSDMQRPDSEQSLSVVPLYLQAITYITPVLSLLFNRAGQTSTKPL